MRNQYTWLADRFPTQDASALAVAAASPVALQPMTLEQFFAAVVAAGGAPTELAKLWAYQQYVMWAHEALNAGDYARTMALLATTPQMLDEATQTAIAAVIAGAKITQGDMAARDMGMPQVADWSAEAIADELDGAGYAWVSGQWVAPAEEQYDPVEEPGEE